MFSLKYGITGFYNRTGTKPPEVDLRIFTEKCYIAARELGGKVLKPTDRNNHAIMNFSYKTLSVYGKDICILINNHYPIISYAIPPVNIGNIDFYECEIITKWFDDNSEYYYPGLAILHNPPERFLNELNSAEIEQIKYWKPTNLGDIIFNFWD